MATQEIYLAQFPNQVEAMLGDINGAKMLGHVWLDSDGNPVQDIMPRAQDAFLSEERYRELREQRWSVVERQDVPDAFVQLVCEDFPLRLRNRDEPCTEPVTFIPEKLIWYVASVGIPSRKIRVTKLGKLFLLVLFLLLLGWTLS